MALDKNGLETALKAIFEADGNDAESVATAMADAIDTYVKTATVTITAQPSEVSVTSPTAGASANASALTLVGGDSTHEGGLS